MIKIPFIWALSNFFQELIRSLLSPGLLLHRSHASDFLQSHWRWSFAVLFIWALSWLKPNCTGETRDGTSNLICLLTFHFYFQSTLLYYSVCERGGREKHTHTHSTVSTLGCKISSFTSGRNETKKTNTTTICLCLVGVLVTDKWPDIELFLRTFSYPKLSRSGLKQSVKWLMDPRGSCNAISCYKAHPNVKQRF